MTIEEMIEELEENYEAAGYADFYERVLKNMSEEEIKKMYEDFQKSFEEAEEDYKKEMESKQQESN